MAVDNTERLAAVGPIDPDHGFPLWFEDGAGVRLDLGVDADPFLPAIGELPTPGAPIQFPGNYPDEAFYFMAEARLPVGGTGTVGRARVIMALEAAFGAAGEPKAGLQIVFARLRVRIDDVVPNADYTVTHPYGETVPLPADEDGRVFYTEDFGIVEGDPRAVLESGRIAPFLKWAVGAPPGYIGDGVSERPITGSPFNTNFVRIIGPSIREGGGQPDPAAPADMDRVWTNLFTVQGRNAQRVGATLGAATYSLTGATPLLSVQASSAPGQAVELVADGVRIALQGNGTLHAGIAEVSTVPASAALFNVTDTPPTRWPINFTDQVIIETAVYDLTAQTLTIAARSSDPGASLSIPALGNLAITSNPEVFTGIAATPATLEVVSDKNGSDRQSVELVGTPAVALSVEASAHAPANGVATEEVILDGTGSRGATSFAWSQTTGPAATLIDGNSAQARFTPAIAGSYAFALTVQGNGGPSTASVTVTIGPEPGPDTLVVSQAQYRTSRQEFRLSGTVDSVPNEVIARIGAFEIGRAAPDITGDWSIRRVLTQAEAGIAPLPGATVEVRSKRSIPPVVQQVLIRN